MARLTAEPDYKECIQNHQLVTGTCAVVSTKAPYKSNIRDAPNEDSYLICEPCDGSAVLAIADGAGGYSGGKAASRLAISLLRTCLASSKTNGATYRNQILDAIESCNERLTKSGKGATTIAVVELVGSSMRPYHVGDSSIMVVGQRGLNKFQSVPHSPVGYGIESGYLNAEVSHTHDDRHWVSNLVGQKEMRIEVGAPFELAPYDTLMICSDGLTDNLSLEKIESCIHKGPIDEALKHLVGLAITAMAKEGGHPDDLTIMLYRRAYSRNSIYARADSHNISFSGRT